MLHRLVLAGRHNDAGGNGSTGDGGDGAPDDAHAKREQNDCSTDHGLLAVGKLKLAVPALEGVSGADHVGFVLFWVSAATLEAP